MKCSNGNKYLILLVVLSVIFLGANLQAATVANIPAGTYPDAVGVNPVTNKIYAMNYSSGTVTVINGVDQSVITTLTASGSGAMGVTVTGGPSYSPSAIAVNPITNRIYIAHYGTNNVTVIDGSSDTVIGTGIAVGTSPMAIAVNTETNTIYVPNNVSGTVSVINGTTNSVGATLTVGTNPRGIAVNPVTNRVYVANWGNNSVSVIDGATNTVTPITGIYSNPERIAVNPVTNKIYVGVHSPSNITVINGVDNTTATTTGTPLSGFSYAPAIAVNPVTNMIYVADGVSAGKVAAINGADNTQLSTTVAVGNTPGALAVNPVTNTLYVGNQNSGTITSIDAAWSTGTGITLGQGAGWALGINSLTNTVYVPAYSAAYVNAVQEGSTPATPLTVTITPFSGNSTTSIPTFAFTTSTGTNWPTVRRVYYQVDSTSGAWQPATVAGTNQYAATGMTLASGSHTVYAFATDGQDSTTVNTGPGASPLVGGVNSYTFSVSPGCYDSTNYTSLQAVSLSGTSIEGSNNGNNRIPTGTVLAYKTKQGRYGKMQILTYGYDLNIAYTTYASDGSVYTSGTMIIHGTWSADLDAGTETTSGSSADFFWEQVDGTVRYLVPQNGALFAVIGNGVACGTTPTSQTITGFSPPSTITDGSPPITLYASASSGLPVSFSIVSGPGSISGNVLTLAGAGTITIKASQPGNAYYYAATDVTATITVFPKLYILTNLPSGVKGTTYSQQLLVTGGVSPYTWSLASGSLPPGLSLNGDTISGTPSQTGTYNFTLLATDSTSPPQTVTRPYTLAIKPPPPTGKIASDGDPKVTVADALRALQIAVGLISPTANDLANGDVAPLVNGKPSPNGTVNVGDAIVILQKSLGIVSW